MQSEAGQKCVGCCLFRKSTTFLSQNAGKKIRCTEVFAPHTAEDFALSDLLHNRDFVSQVAELDDIYAALGAFQVGDAFAAQVIDERFLAQGDKLGFREHGHDFVLHLPDADFAAVETYFIPDSILVIGNNDKTEYWKDADALGIVDAVVARMDAAGYVRSEDKQAANVGLQMSYVRQVTYFVGYDNPYWWWYYPYYWTPGYWGNWGGWHYPYSVYYGYTAGSLLIEMVDLDAEEAADRKLPVIWDSFIGGLLTSDEELNQQRTLAAVEQAFDQSPYLTK